MTPTHIDCTLKDYHLRKEWSHSQIEVLMESPPLFHGRFITGEFPREESSALDIGTVAHAALLEPDGLDAVLAVIPPGVLNDQGHRKGAAWKEWSAEHSGRVQLKRSEASPIIHMVNNVLSHSKAGAWFSGEGDSEYTIVWEDAETGLNLRARLDRVIETSIGTLIADYKTTRAASPREFISDAAKYGYHRQQAWYMDAALAVGMDQVCFAFVASNKTPAHECMAVQLPDRAVELGRQQNRAAINELAWRLSSGNWESRTANDVLELDLPEWAYREDQWRL